MPVHSEAPRILLVKPRHIGDSLLLTPVVRAVREEYPRSIIWVLTRRGSDGILRGCEAIDRVLTTDGEGLGGTWAKMMLLREQKFDHAFELSESQRGRWWVLASGARTMTLCYSSKRHSRLWDAAGCEAADYSRYLGHAVVKDYQTVSMRLPLSGSIPPLEFVPQAGAEPWPELRRFVFVHPGTRWQRKRWEAQKWRELAQELLKYHNALVISTGPEQAECDLAAQIAFVCPERIYTTAGKLSWDANACLLRRADVFVGVDTAMCHLSAASGCPTVALFGPSYEGAWRPWSCPHRLVLPPGFRELDENMADVSEFLQRRTSDIRLEDVLQACRDLARKES